MSSLYVPWFRKTDSSFVTVAGHDLLLVLETLSGLNSMAKYWFRVIAITANGDRVVSPVVERVIQ